MKQSLCAVILILLCAGCAYSSPQEPTPDASIPPDDKLSISEPEIVLENEPALEDDYVTQVVSMAKVIAAAPEEHLRCVLKEDGVETSASVFVPNMSQEILLMINPPESWESALTWQPMRKFEFTGKESAVYFGAEGLGFLVFPIDESEMDLVLLNYASEPIMALKEVGLTEDVNLFKNRVQNWFFVSELDIARICIPNDIPSAQLPGLIAKELQNNYMKLSARNPYSVKNIEIVSTGPIEYLDYEQNARSMQFIMTYAVEPVDIDFPGWWAGGSIEKMEGKYEGWLLYEREIWLIPDPEHNQWRCIA